MIGARVGNFQITRELGRGGMGTVYAATDLASGQQVALKSLAPELMKSQELRDRFVREAQAMARLQHPNIVRFLGWVDDPRHGWFIAMEFVKGEDFDKMLERMGLIPPATAIDLFLPALDALAYAHSLGVIHRDIKPANLMRLDTGVVKVLDFGTAKLTDQGAMTRMGQQIGTSVYMPLEQLMGQPISFAADIYALGVTLYEMITGHLPYYHEDPIQLAKLIMASPPAPPSAIYPPTPKALDAVILRALAREPQQRFANALEFKAALEQVRRTLGPPATGSGGFTAVPAPPQKAPVPAAAPVPTQAAAGARAEPASAGFSAVALGGVVIGFLGTGMGAWLLSAGKGPGWTVFGAAAAIWLGASLFEIFRKK